MSDLRATVVIDYQNVHLTGAGLFTPHEPLHDNLVHPLHYSNRLVEGRNRAQRPGHPPAQLARVLVFRGLPSPEVDSQAYARNLAQQTEWERDRRVSVTHRPLRYHYERDASGRKATDPNGRPLTIGKPQEKGIDVLCALAVVRLAASPATDLVILCSQDTDLAPALDEALSLRRAKVETASWYDPTQRQRSSEILPTPPSRIWNTRLGMQEFFACRDMNDYQLGSPSPRQPGTR